MTHPEWNLIEKVARAIDPEAWDARHPWQLSYRRGRHTRAKQLARAAIDAMREPTEEMVDAGQFKLDPEETRQRWQAMIDKALGG